MRHPKHRTILFKVSLSLILKYQSLFLSFSLFLDKWIINHLSNDKNITKYESTQGKLRDLKKNSTLLRSNFIAMINNWSIQLIHYSFRSDCDGTRWKGSAKMLCVDKYMTPHTASNNILWRSSLYLYLLFLRYLSLTYYILMVRMVKYHVIYHNIPHRSRHTYVHDTQ